MKQKRIARPKREPLLSDFMVSYHGALSPEVCQAIIDTFERDPRRQPSKTAAGVVEKGRSGTIAVMTDDPEQAELKEIVRTKTVECLHDYAGRFSSIEFILKREEIYLPPAKEIKYKMTSYFMVPERKSFGV